MQDELDCLRLIYNHHAGLHATWCHNAPSALCQFLDPLKHNWINLGI